MTLTQFLLISEPVRPPADTVPDADDQSLTPSFPAKRAGISKDNHFSNHVSSDGLIHSRVIGFEHAFGKARKA